MAALFCGCIHKSLADLSSLPHLEVGLRKVQTGARMDEDADRKATQRKDDALAHSTLLPGHNSLILRGKLKDSILGFNTDFTGLCSQPSNWPQDIQSIQRCCGAWGR